MIGLVDCNNFFVSCERLFRPDLLGKPVAVLSSNDGCIVARSQEVKDLGIAMGAPYFQIKELCTKEKITLFSSNFALYRDISARVMNALKSEFETYEIYSVDEAFFNVDDSVSEQYLHDVRSRIMKKTGIPVSIGVARTKTLAKIAGGIAKKGTGVCMLSEDLWRDVAPKLSCGSVWGIGRQTAATLSQEHILTVSELLAQDPTYIKRAFGIVGERLCMELRGISVYPVGDARIHAQESYMSSRSFGTPIMDKLTLMSALGHHAAHLAQKLREDECVCSKITIMIQGSRFGFFSHRKSVEHTILLIPTQDTSVLTKEVSRLLDGLFDADIPYKKAGVVVSGIQPTETMSGSLFEQKKEISNTRKLDTLSDELNKKFGTGTLRSGVTLQPEKWQEQKKQKSQEYTTQWSEIALVKAI